MISVRKKTHKTGYRYILCCGKVKKTLLFYDLLMFKDNTLTSVKRDAKFLTRYVRQVPFLNRRYRKGVT